MYGVTNTLMQDFTTLLPNLAIFHRTQYSKLYICVFVSVFVSV